jgi:hypothetical protein
MKSEQSRGKDLQARGKHSKKIKFIRGTFADGIFDTIALDKIK